MAGSSRPVYSTETGRLCPGCGKPVAQCVCKAEAAARPAGDGIGRIRLETKGRKGKGVTVIDGLPLDESALVKLGGQLKQRCGSGGTVKGAIIEIQGDHRETVIAELTRQGFKVKRAGG